MPDENSAPEILPVELEQAYRLLAYYDARQAPDTTLCRIFSTTVADLVISRQHPVYLDFLAEETAKQEEIAARISDRWANLEDRALGDLADAMDSVADPRLLLGIAVQANKARATAKTAARPQQNGATIDLDSTHSSTTVIRIRTGIAEKITQNGGVERMIAREVDVRTTTAQSVHEAFDPTSVKQLLKTALDVDTTDMRTVTRFGPDASLDFTALEPPYE